MDPISEMQIRALIADEHLKDNSFPINPVQIHLIKIAYQVYKWGGDDFFGKDLATQNTDITFSECKDHCATLVEKGLLHHSTMGNEDVYKITGKGISVAKKLTYIFDNYAAKFSQSLNNYSQPKTSGLSKVADVASTSWNILERCFFVIVSILILIKLFMILFK